MSDQDAPQKNASDPGQLPVADEGGDDRARPSGSPAWLISISLHAGVALLFWLAVFAVRDSEYEMAPLKMPAFVHPPATPPVVADKPPVEAAVDLRVEDPVTPNPVTVEETSVASVARAECDHMEDSEQGRSDAVADRESGSVGAFMAIGAGGNDAGALGNRHGSNKRRALIRGKGSQPSETAVNAALNWFQRHQSANGMWDVEKYPVNCLDAPKCEPGSTTHSGGSDASAAMTAYGVLCFLGAGYDHKTPSKFRNTVRKGVDYLCSVQKADGSFGNRNYEHAVVTMALAEAYAMTGDDDLKLPAQKGVTVILARQAKDPRAADAHPAGLGWDYVEQNPARNDSSVSGWNVMALKSALAAGLHVGAGMTGAASWLERAWKAANKDAAALHDPYAAVSQFPYVWDATTDQIQIDPPGSPNHDMAPVGALCAVFLGHHAGDPMLESLCNHIMRNQFPATYPCNTYYLYYSTLAIFQAGGERWKTWNATVRDLLVKAQRTDAGCVNGSWDWEETTFHGYDHGRILSTAFCCLSLEVYYRYKQVGGAAGQGQ